MGIDWEWMLGAEGQIFKEPMKTAFQIMITTMDLMIMTITKRTKTRKALSKKKFSRLKLKSRPYLRDLSGA